MIYALLHHTCMLYVIGYIIITVVPLFHSAIKSLLSQNLPTSINVREYRRGIQKLNVQRNWQHRIYKAKTNKTKTQHNMCWTPLCANKHK